VGVTFGENRKELVRGNIFAYSKKKQAFWEKGEEPRTKRDLPRGKIKLL